MSITIIETKDLITGGIVYTAVKQARKKNSKVTNSAHNPDVRQGRLFDDANVVLLPKVISHHQAISSYPTPTVHSDSITAPPSIAIQIVPPNSKCAITPDMGKIYLPQSNSTDFVTVQIPSRKMSYQQIIGACIKEPNIIAHFAGDNDMAILVYKLPRKIDIMLYPKVLKYIRTYFVGAKLKHYHRHLAAPISMKYTAGILIDNNLIVSEDDIQRALLLP